MGMAMGRVTMAESEWAMAHANKNNMIKSSNICSAGNVHSMIHVYLMYFTKQ